MRVTSLVRGLPVILALAVIFLGGCRSQSPRFYTLNPIPAEPTSSRKSLPPNTVIGIGPVEMADYLDESLIVTRTGDNQAVKAQFDRWVGSFKDNFDNVLADNLGVLLGTERIYLYPWRLSVPIDYQVVLDIIRCDGRLGDAAWLEVRWSILQGQEKKLVKMHRSSIREPVSGADYAALVAAQSQALAKLSQDIAAAIQTAGKN